jgi:hypothetical protein
VDKLREGIAPSEIKQVGYRPTGARTFGYLGSGGIPVFQVTRRKRETLSRRQ